MFIVLAGLEADAKLWLVGELVEFPQPKRPELAASKPHLVCSVIQGLWHEHIHGGPGADLVSKSSRLPLLAKHTDN